MGEATHAVAVKVRSDDFEASIEELHERIVPRASSAPGFVHGYWTRKDDGGLAMILFDSEDAAQGAMEQIRTAGPETANVEDIELREVVAQA